MINLINLINLIELASRNRSSERRPDRLLLLPLIAGLAMGVMLLPAACKKKEEPPPVVVDTAPPPPPPPQPTVAELMAKYNIDPRITIAEDEIPVDLSSPEAGTRKLVAVLQFFDAMVRGSDAKLKPMLASADQTVLAELVQQGLFAPAAKNITRVLLGCGVLQLGSESTEAVFALVQSGGSFDPQLWSFAAVGEGSDSFVFTAAPTPPDVISHLSGSKAAPRIRQWSDLIKAKLEEAKRPDEVIEMPPVDYTDSEGAGTSGGAPSPGPAPSPGGSEPGRKVNPGGVPAPRPPPVR